MRYTILASGSKGNAAVVEHNGFRVLIDCGLSFKDLSRRLKICGMMPEDLHGVLITHFHSDHLKGIPELLKNIPLEVYSRSGFQWLPFHAEWNTLKHQQQFKLGEFTVHPVSLPHDDGGSFGFMLTAGARSLVYATDLGEPTPELVELLGEANALIIESNHDRELLACSAYPDFVKDRIASAEGHLSNCQCAALLAQSSTKKCGHVVLAHLSERANTPGHAKTAVQSVFPGLVSVATQSEPTQWFQDYNDKRIDIESLATSAVRTGNELR